MSKVVMNFKIDAQLKKEAMQTAEELGLSLSTVVRRMLVEFINSKRVIFAEPEIPSDHLKRELDEAEEDIRAGRVSPTFTNAKDAIAWLHKGTKSHARKVHNKIRKTVQKSRKKHSRSLRSQIDAFPHRFVSSPA